MNKNFIIGIFALLIASSSVNAQRHELGVRFGLSNLVGDIGRTNFLLPKPMSAGDISQVGLPLYGGVIYRMNFNPYQTLRFDVGYHHIQFDDRIAKEEYRRNRKLWGTNNLLEGSAIFEYNFFPVNNEQPKGMVSPYIFAGLGAMMFDATQANISHDFYRDADGVALAPENQNDFVTNVTYESGKKVTAYLPFGIGLKYKFNQNWALNGELMFRPTITDQLDYSSTISKDVKTFYNNDILAPGTGTSLLQNDIYFLVAKEREKEFVKSRNVGDPNSKDWVNSVTFGLTYSFGRPPCYCE